MKKGMKWGVIMLHTFPGTEIEVSEIKKGASKALFDGIFATGGITLSQVSVMTGLEPYVIQNWVKRGFVASPVKRVYGRAQFARIIIINMLKEALQLEKICELVKLGPHPLPSALRNGVLCGSRARKKQNCF